MEYPSKDWTGCGGRDTELGLISGWEWVSKHLELPKREELKDRQRVEKQTLTPIAKDKERRKVQYRDRELLGRETLREDPDCALNSQFCLRLLWFLLHISSIWKEGETEETLIFFFDSLFLSFKSLCFDRVMVSPRDTKIVYCFLSIASKLNFHSLLIKSMPPKLKFCFLLVKFYNSFYLVRLIVWFEKIILIYNSSSLKRAITICYQYGFFFCSGSTPREINPT